MACGTSREDGNIFFAYFRGRGEQLIEGELEYFNDYYPHDEQTPRLVTLPESRFVSLAGL